MIKINSYLLKSFRVKKGLNQEDVAKMIGMSVKSYCNKENGKSILILEEIKSISNVLELTPEQQVEIFLS